MSKFSYKARRMNGALVQGFIEAENILGVKAKLSEQGLIPIQVKASSESFRTLKNLMKKSVKSEEILLFTKQFATLFKAGMGMESIMSTLSAQSKNPTMKEALDTIKNDIQEGASLANSFSKHPRIFDELYVNMLASGEEAGILEEVLSQLADVLTKDFAMRKGIKSAMMYPVIVVVVLVLAGIALMTMVVPKFKSIFSQLGAELPLPTRILIATSDFLTSYYAFLGVAAVIGFIYMFKQFYSTPKGKLIIDQIIFKIWVFGPLAYKVCNARFANILSCLYRSGLPLTKALDITGNVLDNEAFSKDVRMLQSEVEKGHGIADSMRNLKYFSPVIVEASSIGERTGSLDSMLTSIGEHYDMEIDHTIKNLTTFLEPILLVLIFSMVAVFALAIFLPIWGMSDAMLK